MKGMFFKADLPLPPSINHYWGKSVARANGRQFVKVYLTPKAKQFRADVIAHIASKGSVKTHKGRIRAVMTLHPSTNHKTDLDNFFKGVGDALTHARVYQDDSQIDELYVKRGKTIRGGKVTVKLYEVRE